MEVLIKEYLKLEENIRRKFKCEEDFFLKPMIGNKWAINTENDTCFLSYLDNNDSKKNTCYVVSKNSKPMIYKKDDITMIIAIDCIKIAFIFENKNKL